MIKLSVLAQTTMDKFYQGFAPRDRFFTKEDFIRDCGLEYSKLMNELYKQEKKENRMMEGFSFVELSPAMLIPEILEIKHDSDTNEVYAVTSQKFFSFDYDSMVNSLQLIQKVGGNCGEFIKISLTDAPFVCKMPTNNKVFFYGEGCNKIIFLNATCMPKKVKSFYCPDILSNPAAMLSETMAESVQAAVLQLYFGAKQGMVIQKVNDGNPNLTIQNQENTQK